MKRFVFGTGPIAMGEARQHARRSFASILSDVLDCEVVVVVAANYEQLAGLISRDEAHAAWLPPAVYVQAHDRAGAQLILRAHRISGSRFRGCFFVDSRSSFNDIRELRGGRVAWVDRRSCSGYLFPRLALRACGLDPSSYFGEELVVGSHGAVARAVAAGQADVGATFIDQTIASSAVEASGSVQERIRPGWTLETDPEAMRSILESDPVPGDTICGAPGLDEETRLEVRDVLANMHHTSIGLEVLHGLFGVERFEPAEFSEYDVVRDAMVEAGSLRPPAPVVPIAAGQGRAKRNG